MIKRENGNKVDRVPSPVSDTLHVFLIIQFSLCFLSIYRVPGNVTSTSHTLCPDSIQIPGMIQNSELFRFLKGKSAYSTFFKIPPRKVWGTIHHQKNNISAKKIQIIMFNGSTKTI